MNARYGSLASILLVSVFVLGGCRTDLSVNFRNGTAGEIIVKSSQTGKTIDIQPAHLKKLPHSHGDLIVTTQDGRTLSFHEVLPAELDRRFWSGRDNPVGPDSIVITLSLEPDDKLYALRPGKTSVEHGVKQPQGYPKTSGLAPRTNQ